MKKQFLLAIITVLLIGILSSCGMFGGESPVGKWYNSRGKCLEIRSDGTWKLEGSYGTGTWKKLDGEVYEFTDFYGDTQESEINKDEKGEYIDFDYYGNFYRDSYPTEAAKANGTSLDPGFSGSNDSYKTPEPTSSPEPTPQAVSIDPFDGIRYDVSGISPYCKVSINNQGCSDEAQEFVKYTINGERFENGDTVKITAELIFTQSQDGGTVYSLTKTEDEYRVENAPYYVESLDGLDVSLLVSELNDKIIADTAFESKNSLYDILAWSFLKKLGRSNNTYCNYYGVQSVKDEEAYILTLKKNKRDNIYNGWTYNDIVILCSIYANASHEGSPHDKSSNWYGEGYIYVAYEIQNVICYPDGHLGFGVIDPNNHDIGFTSTLDSLETLKAISVDKWRTDSNVTKIEGIDWITQDSK